MRTVVDNLISNALKFSPRSSTIALHLFAEQRDAVLEVTDEGPGVRADERSAIFESFYQGSVPTGGRVKARASASLSRASTRWRMAAASTWPPAPTAGVAPYSRLRVPLAFAAAGAMPAAHARSTVDAR